MQFTTLGRTGLNVSVVGLGTGGPSRLGLANGRPVDSIVRLIEYGLDQGINLIDLGATYGTDKIVAKAIGKRRHEVVLSAKTVLGPHIWMFEGTRTASKISARLGETTSFVTSGRSHREAPGCKSSAAQDGLFRHFQPAQRHARAICGGYRPAASGSPATEGKRKDTIGRNYRVL